MTSEEAIDLLDNLNGMIEDSRNSDYDAAFKMAIKALEQEPKSEWQHDHEILKAYSDGANDVLDKIRAEIMQLEYDEETVDYDHNDMPQTEIIHTICREEVLRIIDKYRADKEE